MDFNIGNIKIEGGLCLGPMAGVTDLPFRSLCREQGCGLVCTEMVSAKAIYYKNKGTAQLLQTEKDEHPLAVQLFGSDPDIVSDMAVQIEDGDWDIIDFNMGCPVPKVVSNHEGSALMRNPKLTSEILTAMVKKLHKPVTLKIRKGFNDDEVNAVEIAKIAEAAGVAAIAVHGRTREQYYSGKADWNIIKEVKDAIKIPVIGNGDIYSGEDAKRMYEETGCDGIMIARGAQGNPWIFREVSEYLKTGKVIDRPSVSEVKQMILRHLDMEIDLQGEYLGIRQMRKHIAWYTHGLTGSSAIRRQINTTEDLDVLKKIIMEISETHV